MEQPLWFLPQAYPIELGQLIAAVVGLVANFATIYYARGDVAFVAEHENRLTPIEGNYRIFIANRNFIEEVARLIVNIIFVSVGIVSILNPPPSSHAVAQDLSFQLAYTRIALTLASVALTFKSVKDLTDRRHLQHMMRIEKS